MFSRKKPSYILDSFQKGMQWIRSNTVNGGIAHSSSLRKPYPEVTGYFIPSLLKWGEVELAKTYGDWLVSIQTPKGAWQELNLQTIYTFDTGQILKGLYELIPYDEKYEKAFIKGCDWLLSQINAEGRVQTPTLSALSTIGNEYIHLYAIEPLKLAATKYNRTDYADGLERAIQYYLAKTDLIDWEILTHFHAYIVEALIDLGYKEKAIEALNIVKKKQRASGAIPAFHKVRWTCLTALMQYAVCYYKLGMLAEGNKLLDYAISKQNKSGGFYGGQGWFVTYFKNTEISWPVKYLLDAIHLRLQLEFAEKKRAEHFLSKIKHEDGRYQLLKEIAFESADKKEITTLLDVGCGKGRFIHNLIVDGFKGHITALDISDVLFGYLPNECEKKVGSICQMPITNEQYEIVFCCEVLEHAVNINAAVSELARVCKTGGTVIIIDKDITRLKNIQLEVWEQWFDKEELQRIMFKNGLQTMIKELATTDGPPICAWIGKKIEHAQS